MASADTLCRKLLRVKNCVVESCDIYNDKNGVAHLRMKARPNVWHQDDCPFCGKRRPGYDRPTKRPKVWRGLDYGGILVEIEYHTHRIQCPEHGIITAAVPWAYPDSSFTREFDLTVVLVANGHGLKMPEHLTQKQLLRLEMIQANDPQLYRAYRLKETLRLILKTSDVAQAEKDLKGWLWWASHSRIPAFKELYKKIKRHKEHILNTIRLGLSNARIEATNNKIKLIIRKAYGFRNIQNMMDMVYLVCSNIRIPLPNRKSSQPKAV